MDRVAPADKPPEMQHKRLPQQNAGVARRNRRASTADGMILAAPFRRLPRRATAAGLAGDRDR